MTVPSKKEITEFYTDNKQATIKDLMRKFHGRLSVNAGLKIHNPKAWAAFNAGRRAG